MLFWLREHVQWGHGLLGLESPAALERLPPKHRNSTWHDEPIFTLPTARSSLASCTPILFRVVLCVVMGEVFELLDRKCALE